MSGASCAPSSAASMHRLMWLMASETDCWDWWDFSPVHTAPGKAGSVKGGELAQSGQRSLCMSVPKFKCVSCTR